MKKGLFLITTAMLLASCSFFVDQAKDTVKKVSEISEEAANQAATKAGEIVGGSAVWRYSFQKNWLMLV